MKPLKKADPIANKHRLEATRLLRTVDFENLQPFPDFPISEFDTPADIATAVRALWRVPARPLPGLVALVTATGVPVCTADLAHEKLFAMSMPGTATRHVIRTSTSNSPASPAEGNASPGNSPPEEPRLIRHDLERFEDKFCDTRKELRELLVITQERLESAYLGERQQVCVPSKSNVA